MNDDAIWAAIHETQRCVDEARREAYLKLDDEYVPIAEWLDRATVMLAHLGQLLEEGEKCSS